MLLAGADFSGGVYLFSFHLPLRAAPAGSMADMKDISLANRGRVTSLAFALPSQIPGVSDRTAELRGYEGGPQTLDASEVVVYFTGRWSFISVVLSLGICLSWRRSLLGSVSLGASLSQCCFVFPHLPASLFICL